MRRIAILGGGFAGAACALHLLRDHPGLVAELVVIEPRERLGAGLAYSAPGARAQDQRGGGSYVGVP